MMGVFLGCISFFLQLISMSLKSRGSCFNEQFLFFTKFWTSQALEHVSMFSFFGSNDSFLCHFQVFYEEELDVPLVLFNEVLEHVLRIDRIFRQPQGHVLLIGVSGAGKTTLSRFVAWMNGLSVVQVKVGSLLQEHISLKFVSLKFSQLIILDVYI